MSAPLRNLAPAVAVLLAAASARATSTRIKIEPGPSVISPEEAAIVADPSAGSQHGVVLLEETDRDEGTNMNSVVTYHMRAKILSPEARSLGDIQIPGLRAKGDLESWWGRTILPSGEVLELAQKDLKVETTQRVESDRSLTLKGALPGVAPGCVVDYGYEVRRQYAAPLDRVVLQKSWPVRLQRYRWQPSSLSPASYVPSRIEGKDIEIKVDKSAVLVTARNLSPVPEEPYMAPMEEVRASVILYYISSKLEPKDFWNEQGQYVEDMLKRFVGNGSAVRDAVASMAIPPQATVAEKLATAYTWLGANVANTWRLTAEEEEEQKKQDGDDKVTAKSVLAAKRGTGFELDMLYAGIARNLGAGANLVYATDRRYQFWSQRLKTMQQFDFTFVRVRIPGVEGDILVDPGSGLAFGQIPWQATGVEALECSASGGTPFLVPPGKPQANWADTTVSMELAGDDPSLHVTWSRSSSGAAGIGYRLWLRDLDPEERKKTLDELCAGKDGAYEVTRADLPGLTEASAPYRIGCGLALEDSGMNEDTTRWSTSLTGPWWPAAPDLPSSTRTNPVVFEYPRVDTVSIDVKAPPGFVSAAPPAPVRIDSRFGRYELQLKVTEQGVHVDRMLTLLPLIVDVADYAALRSFLQDAARDDRTPLVFDRKGGAR